MVDVWDGDCISETSGRSGEDGRIKSSFRVNYGPWEGGVIFLLSVLSSSKRLLI